MSGLADSLSLWGVSFIVRLQMFFKGYDELLTFASHCGDPRNAFLVYFPVAYFCRPSVGIKVMWAAVMSEWLNALLKWVLFGERPYWWIYSSGLYDKPPSLQQYAVTCETGPGNPSGHAMVTAAVWFILVHAFVSHMKTRHTAESVTWLYTWAAWMMYGICLVPVALSRLFIATHFPHQVVLGVLVGIIVGHLARNYDTDQLSVHSYVFFCASLLVSGPAIFWILKSLGFDPLWTMNLAKKWCARSEWVHLDTTLFFALTRDASSLLGLGVALQCVKNHYVKLSPESTMVHRMLLIAVSLTLCRGLERLHPPAYYPAFFYILAFIKYFSLPFMIIIFLPKFIHWMVPTNCDRASKNS